jgi:uncharacterized GH25 family protein
MTKFRNIIITGAVLLTLFLAVSAHAHYMWLNVNDYTPSGKSTAKFTIGWGHHFYNPVGDILVGGDRLGEIYLIDPSGERIAVDPQNEFQYESAKRLGTGTYLAIVKRKEGFSTKTTDGYKQQSRKGLENVIHSRYIGMYGKAIINVGRSSEAGAIETPVGDALEFIPLDNPADLKAGDYFRFKLLFQGEPVAEYVNATYLGFSQEDDWAYSTRTDSKGIGEIKILHSGPWILKANHKADYPDPEEADEYSYTSSLTFEVR